MEISVTSTQGSGAGKMVSKPSNPSSGASAHSLSIRTSPILGWISSASIDRVNEAFSWLSDSLLPASLPSETSALKRGAEDDEGLSAGPESQGRSPCGGSPGPLGTGPLSQQPKPFVDVSAYIPRVAVALWVSFGAPSVSGRPGGGLAGPPQAGGAVRALQGGALLVLDMLALGGGRGPQGPSHPALRWGGHL